MSSKIKNLIPKTTVVASDELAINDVAGGCADKKAGMDDIKTYMSLSPTLVTPALGTPASGVATNITGLPTAGLVNDAVTLAKMASGTAGNLITYNACGNPVAVVTGNCGQILTSNGACTAPTFQCAAGGGLTYAAVVKSADESIQSSTTLQDDDELTFAVSANKEYYVYNTLFYTGESLSVALKYAFTVPSGATMLDGSNAIYIRGINYTSFDDDSTTTRNSPGSTVLRGATTLHKLSIGGTAGNVTLQWAQDISTAEDMTVKAGSTLLVWES